LKGPRVGADVGAGVGHAVDVNDVVRQYRKQGLWYAVLFTGSHTMLTTLGSHIGHSVSFPNGICWADAPRVAARVSTATVDSHRTAAIAAGVGVSEGAAAPEAWDMSPQ
jgi:hypothetical protein